MFVVLTGAGESRDHGVHRGIPCHCAAEQTSRQCLWADCVVDVERGVLDEGDQLEEQAAHSDVLARELVRCMPVP